MIRTSDGALRLRLPPAEARARIVRAFDPDAPEVRHPIGGRDVVRVEDRTFALRDRASRAAMQYVLHGRIEEDPLGARVVLERRLRGGMLGVLIVGLGVVASVGLFVLMIHMGRGGLIEWLGLMFLPWVLFILGQGLYRQLALARTEIAAVKERLAIVFDDVIIASDAGPYR